MPAHARKGVSGSDFRWFWTAYAVSTFGDQITMVALPLAVFARTESALSVGIAASMQSLTAVALGLLAGAYADRLRHRPILIATDMVRGALLGAVAVAVLQSDSYSVLMLYAAAFVMGALRVLHDAAAGAALPRVVSGADLLSANGRLSGSESAGNIGGPAIAGALVALGGAGLALAADALSFVLSAISVSAVRPLRDKRSREQARIARDRSVRDDVIEGLRVVWADRPFMHGLVLVAAMNVVAVAVEAQFIPYAKELLHIGLGCDRGVLRGGGDGRLDHRDRPQSQTRGPRRRGAGGRRLLRRGCDGGRAGALALERGSPMWPPAWERDGDHALQRPAPTPVPRAAARPGGDGGAHRALRDPPLGAPRRRVGRGRPGPRVLFIVAASIGLIATAWGAAIGFGRVRMGDVIDLTD